MDGKPVHTLFTIVSPTTRAHLHLMSKLSFVLRDAEVRRAIKRQESRQEILRADRPCRTAARDVECRKIHRRSAGPSHADSD